MKKYFKKSIISAVSLACLFGAVSCKKILDLQPHDATFTSAYFTDGEDANTAIAGAYALLRSTLLNNYSYYVFGDIPAGEFSPNTAYDDANANVALGQFTGLNVGPGIWNWQSNYQLIQQINLIINKVPGIDISKFTNQDDKLQITGEAYFLRAYIYFYMSRVWGDVPLKLAPDLDISTAVNIPRSPAATVLAQCLADLKIAEADLKYGYTDVSQTAVRANKGSAMALQAHIKEWMGDYAGCDTATNAVITQGGYSLLDSADYSKIFIGKSAEGIFEINIDYSQNEGLALNGGGYIPTLEAPFLAKKTYLEWPLNTSYFNRLYTDTNDIRIRKFFYQPTSSAGQTIKYSNITYADGSAQNDPRLSNNIIIFRLADIMLLRAEALNHLGRDAEAVTLLNQIRTRANTVPYQGAGSALATAILEERLRELFYEGQSYYDLVRTKQLTNYNQSFSSAQFLNGSPKGGWLWPVDPNMFKDDFTLTQTPYWQGKL
ncbi:Starch-binding associating with outer membrane [Mucilaginibacter mallensis]|uniref:Starch-binding associating with outer membrane n=1 Tax=Mucilaginibacter mallensis TaxID=652787 RepID=A0A1H1VFW6_MUCMA|nr:RagB/SusD family nutrient uptake outer membrane protein [Mucilaginibacter mallensis]SDS83575.1 Starch-binding associating with outer membrane [Mucilaginibacter mallensis]